MPSNIEIKARVSDFERKRALAEALAKTPPVVLQQQDSFYPCPQGRLKLRQLSETEGVLIAYSRPDVSGTKRSDYETFRTDSPAGLHAVLSAALGTGLVVTKTRLLYVVGPTRIHLDSVVGLGTFVELEVVLKDGEPVEEGHRLARECMRALEISEEDLLDGAYADLLAAMPLPPQPT